ncbi:MAG: hypothetical protein QOF02_2422 [Blastocatellia bacterium]|jgi:hypothetical protein|nr:hypothetical protein [Blastocatellia bacterium]
MLKGFYLTLMIGPAVPVPAPKVVTEALISAQVTTGGERTGFQLVFGISKNSPLQTMLATGFFDPGITRVCLVATVGAVPTVLSDGIITRHELAPSSEAGKSTLTITGEDLSILMDVIDKPIMRYPAMPAPARILVILAQYAIFGIVPLVIPPIFMDVPIPTKEIPTQTGSDLAYIKQLSNTYGHVFYIEPGPVPLANLAYWGPDIRIPIPQPALNINMDAHTNVESLTISMDGLAKKILVLTVMDPITGKIPIPIPIPNISLLRPPLGARLTPPMKVEFSRDVSHRSPLAAAAIALARTSASSDAITASGSLNVLRYGRILKARQLVGVRGVGLAYDGLYYVKTVTHNIKRGEYKQSFTLSRDGLISLTPKVVP